jgi:phage FluMu protein Com
LSPDFKCDVEDVLMQIIARCPGCANNWLLDAGAADRRTRCPKCHRLFKIPKLDEVPKAIKVIKQAKGSVYVDQNGKTYG